MTTPSERTRAVMHTREFLEDLCDSQCTPGVPNAVRVSARRLLRHYPSPGHLDMAAVAWPMYWERLAPEPSFPLSYLELVSLVGRSGLAFASGKPVSGAPGDVRVIPEGE